MEQMLKINDLVKGIREFFVLFLQLSVLNHFKTKYFQRGMLQR